MRLWESGPNSVLVSPGYAPIEQYNRHGRLGPWTDVYAAAATLYRMLTGKSPLPADSRIPDDKLERPEELVPDLSSELSWIVKEGLAILQENRIPDAGEFTGLLLPFLKPLAPVPGPPPADPEQPSPPPETPATPPIAEDSDSEPLAKDSSSGVREPESAPAPYPPPNRPVQPSVAWVHPSSMRLREWELGQPSAGYIPSRLTRLKGAMGSLIESTVGPPLLGILAILLFLLSVWLMQPVAMPDEAMVSLGEEIVIPVLSNDRTYFGVDLHLNSVGLPSGGKARLGPNDSVIYTPAPGFSGPDRFTYTMTNDWLSDSTEVRVMVRPPGAGEVRRNGLDGLEYAWIPPGRFQMGCMPEVDGPCRQDDGPAGRVVLARGFWLSTTEVTIEAFKRFKEPKAGTPASLAPDFNPRVVLARIPGKKPPAPRPSDITDQEQPRGNVTWGEAYKFCQWSGGRLPTEAEWEYAARGGKSQKYPWGNENPVHLETAPNGAAFDSMRQAKVGSFRANAFQLFDMAGNVYEWCAGPIGALPFSVTKGGSWRTSDWTLRPAHRSFTPRDSRRDDLGFRCARDTPPLDLPRSAA